MTALRRAEYHLLTIWCIQAPLEKVYAAIEDSLRWPDWWPAVRQVAQMAEGVTDGTGNVRRYAWQGKLPYRIVFDIRVTRIEKLAAIEGIASGNLDGEGRWDFSCQGTTTIVRYEWHVRSDRWWMNLIAPIARPLFIRNHAQIMAQGGEALARMLNASVVSVENIDVMAATIKQVKPSAPYAP